MKKILKYIVIILMLFIILITLTACGNENSIKTSDINYEILTNRNIINELKISDRTNRGYEVIQQDDFYYLVIKYGENPSYYSKLDITKVEIDGNDLKVWAELPKNEGMGDAFSYPMAIIKLDRKPKKVKIIYE